MKMASWFKKKLDRIEKTVGYHRAAQILEITSAICDAMERRGVTRADLARRLGTTPSRVTKVLSGDENMTIGTLAKIGAALGCPLQVSFGDSILEFESESPAPSDSARHYVKATRNMRPVPQRAQGPEVTDDDLFAAA